MRNASLKDTIREIRNKPSRFISILLIVAIGTSFFVGLKATCPDMKLTADAYFKSTDLSDLHILSTLGFEDADVQALRDQKEIAAVMPSYTTDALMAAQGSNIVVKVHAMPKAYDASSKTLNNLVLLSGSLPQKSGECVVEQNNLQNPITFNLGDTVVFLPEEGKDISDSLKVDTFVVVGFVDSPQYISLERGSSTIGSGSVGCFMFIPSEDFNYSVYTDIYVSLSATMGISAFGNEYSDAVATSKDILGPIGEQRSMIRYINVKSEADIEIKDAKQKLSDGEKEYDDALATYKRKITANEKKLNSAYKQYNQEKAKYVQANDDFQSTKPQALAQIDQKQKELDQLHEQILALQTQIDATPSDDPNLPAMEQQLADMTTQYDGGTAQLSAQKAQLESTENQLAQTKIQLEQTKTQLDSQHRKLDRAKKDAQKDLDEAKVKIDDAKKDIAKAQDELDDLEVPEWMLFSREDNPGYAGYRENADRMDGVATLFPLFFLLVVCLVCLTTMLRMVEEQRTQIGTYKALGYNHVRIASKYFCYAVLASILGSVAGIFAGYVIFPKVIYGAFDIMYSLPPVITVMPWGIAILSVAVTVLCTTLTAVFACVKELLSQPSLLMRPKPPKPGKRIFLEKTTFLWSRMSFISKITGRNLFRYKIRFYMTVLGIAGCMALMVAGFGLKSSVSMVVNKQFGEIYRYDMVFSLKDNLSAQDKFDMDASISADSRIQSDLFTCQQMLHVQIGAKKLEVSIFVPDDVNKLAGFVSLRHRSDGTGIGLSDSGVVITEKLADMLRVKIGDTISLKDGDRTMEYNITDITENYVHHYVYMTPNVYEQAYGEKPQFNTILANLSDKSDAVKKLLASYWLKNDKIMTVWYVTNVSKTFADSIDSLNSVVLVMIICAGLLAFVVLYNLTNINISERVREIATIKVLGFYDNETSNFVFRENIILMLLGMIAGAFLGVVLHHFVVASAEMDIVMFGRTLNGFNYLFSGLLTVLFTVVVNFVMHFRLRKIDMVESLKSLD